MKSKQEIIALGIFACLLITTYTSFSYIVTFIYDIQGQKFMGPLLLFSNYFIFLLANSVAPGFNIKLKNQFLISAFCYTLNYALMLFNETSLGSILSVIGSLAGGFGAAIFWICYGAYTKSLCSLNDEEDIQGKYFSLLGSITFLSSILGPLVTTFALGFFSAKIYFITLTVFGALSFAFGYLFIKDIDYVNKLQDSNCWTRISSNCRYYSQMKSIIAFLVFDGLALGFVSASVLKVMPETPNQSLYSGIFLIVLGFGSNFGSVLSGIMSDRYQMKNVGRSAIIFILFCCLFTLFILKFENFMMSYVCAFIWGYALQYLQGWTFIMCSRKFNGALQAYANSKQMHSITFCLYQIYLIATNAKEPIWYSILFLIVLAAPAFIFLNLPSHRQMAIDSHQISQQDSLKQIPCRNLST